MRHALLAVGGLLAIDACTPTSVDATAQTRVDADCSVIALAARAPDVHSVTLNDAAVRALGERALTGVIEACDAIDPWTAYQLERWRYSLLPQTRGVVISFAAAPRPAAVIEQTRRTCGDQYEQVRHVAYGLPMREFGYAIFDGCELVSRGILKDSDLDYVRPPPLEIWRIHQILLESEVPSDLPSRYFTAILLALEVEDRAGGAVEVRDDRVEVAQAHDDPVVVQLDTDGRLQEPRLLIAFDRDLDVDSGCVLGRVSIGATVPIGNLRWLFDAASERDDCAYHNRIELAVSERADLFRPLRAVFDLPPSGLEHKAELELTVDSTGAWRADDGTAEGSDAAALAATLDRRKPASLRVRTSASTAASVVVDVLRVADVWSARARRSLDVWLEIE